MGTQYALNWLLFACIVILVLVECFPIVALCQTKLSSTDTDIWIFFKFLFMDKFCFLKKYAEWTMLKKIVCFFKKKNFVS